jgi:hypothetical protein
MRNIVKAEVPKEIACTKCGLVKPLTEEFFLAQTGYRYGFTRWCHACRLISATAWHKESRDQYRAEHAFKQRGSNIDKFKAYEFAREMKKYSTTVDWYRDKLVEQRGVCAICCHLSRHHGTLQRLQVDHNHDCCDVKTKSCGECLRGLLCADCNMLLSYLEKFLAEALVMPFPTLIGTRESWTGRAMRYLDSYNSVTKEGSA